MRSNPSKHLVLTLALLGGLLLVLPAAGQDFTGTWQNELGSYLSITSSNPLVGQYVNMAPNTGCRGVPYPIQGSTYGNTLVFSVKWQGVQSCNSQTSWTGFLYQGKIFTLWNLVVNRSTSTRQIIQGADTFHQLTQTEFESFHLDEPGQ